MQSGATAPRGRNQRGQFYLRTQSRQRSPSGSNANRGGPTPRRPGQPAGLRSDRRKIRRLAWRRFEEARRQSLARHIPRHSFTKGRCHASGCSTTPLDIDALGGVGARPFSSNPGSSRIASACCAPDTAASPFIGTLPTRIGCVRHRPRPCPCRSALAQCATERTTPNHSVSIAENSHPGGSRPRMLQQHFRLRGADARTGG